MGHIIIIMLILVIATAIASISSVPLASHVERRDGGFDRRSAQISVYDDYDPEDQVAAEDSPLEAQVVPAPAAVDGRVSAKDLANLLRAAGVQYGANPIDRNPGYGKRSAENNEKIVATKEDSSNDEDAHLQETGVSASDIAHILRIAGAVPQPIVEGDRSYAGKRKRSAMDHQQEEIIEEAVRKFMKRSAQSDDDQIAVETNNNEESAPFSLANLLASDQPELPEGVKPVSTGRRFGGYGKRSPQEIVVTNEDHDDVDDAPAPAGLGGRLSSSVLAKLLKTAGVEVGANPVDRNPGYGKRSAEGDEAEEEGLVESVPLSAVKIKPHSSQGNIVQHYDGDAGYQTSVHSSRFGRTKREDNDQLKNFIPFHVYDDRRVKTLKVEQNDFLALKGKQQAARKAKSLQS